MRATQPVFDFVVIGPVINADGFTDAVLAGFADCAPARAAIETQTEYRIQFITSTTGNTS